MPSLSPTARTTFHRYPGRGSYDRALIDAILDEALVCHVGFCDEGQPYVLPMNFARVGDAIYLHGSAVSRLLVELRRGAPVCATVTLLDGLVLARAAFRHSMNYRSVVMLGVAREVTAADEKRAALAAIVEHVLPGRSAAVRGPSEAELASTLVLALPIAEASAKVRAGPPLDAEDDLGIPCWAGEIPLRLTAGPPRPDPTLPPGVEVPETVSGYDRPPR
jgi:nitroimidazol reductase NimA-like FMN-containing flavoprotein (pyridoxamine 5'-phosphate oxidase superfamily)